MGKSKQKRADESVARLPKKKCCESKDRCGRCPLRMLKEGTLPEGYTVHKRRLVKVEDMPVKASKEEASPQEDRPPAPAAGRPPPFLEEPVLRVVHAAQRVVVDHRAGDAAVGRRAPAPGA